MDWRTLVSKAAPVLFVLGLGTYFLEKLSGITWFPEVIVAWGTIVLALATYRLGRTTKEENAKLIADREYERELASKRRRLDEIQHWTEEALTFSFGRSGSPEIHDIAGTERFRLLERLLKNSLYISLEAAYLDSDVASLPNLKGKYTDTAKNLVNALREQLELTQDNREVFGDEKSREKVKGKCELILTMISDLRVGLRL